MTSRSAYTAFFPGFQMHCDNPWNTVASLGDATEKCDLVALELCAGAGGQALGLEFAGIKHAALLEIDKISCETLCLNRPGWKVLEADLNTFVASGFAGVDIVSGGLPCPPFSVAGRQLGELDQRNLFPAMMRIVDEVRPKAVMIENVRGILNRKFRPYRQHVSQELRDIGYEPGWNLMNAFQFGVAQSRCRAVLVALRREYSKHFTWPTGLSSSRRTVGEEIYDLMAGNHWKGAQAWRSTANDIAPTIVGGSNKHGGPDLGPTRARRAWAVLGVDGTGIADAPPEQDFVGKPRLTARMVARLQGFPDEWKFAGKKTRVYRQIGNAFPPPFAAAVARSVKDCLMLNC